MTNFTNWLAERDEYFYLEDAFRIINSGELDEGMLNWAANKIAGWLRKLAIGIAMTIPLGMIVSTTQADPGVSGPTLQQHYKQDKAKGEMFTEIVYKIELAKAGDGKEFVGQLRTHYNKIINEIKSNLVGQAKDYQVVVLYNFRNGKNLQLVNTRNPGLLGKQMQQFAAPDGTFEVVMTVRFVKYAGKERLPTGQYVPTWQLIRGSDAIRTAP